MRVANPWAHGANNITDSNHHVIGKKLNEVRQAQLDRVSSDSWRESAPYELALPTTGFACRAYCEAKIEEVSHHDAPRYEAGHHTAHKILV